MSRIPSGRIDARIKAVIDDVEERLIAVETALFGSATEEADADDADVAPQATAEAPQEPAAPAVKKTAAKPVAKG